MNQIYPICQMEWHTEPQNVAHVREADVTAPPLNLPPSTMAPCVRARDRVEKNSHDFFAIA